MPGESVYIDTSVLGAYYCPETSSATAEHALRQVAGPVVSTLTEVEFCSLIARKRRLRELSQRQAEERLNLFGLHVTEGYYRRVSLTSEHFLKARQLLGAPNSALRTLDALHLAVSITESLALMTADRALAKAARRHRARVILVK